LIKVLPLEIPDLNIENEFLVTLVPKGMEKSISKYKDEITKFINENISKYESKDKIDEFLKKNNLNNLKENMIIKDPDLNKIEAWKNYCKIKENGDYKYLFNKLLHFDSIHEEIIQKINRCELILYVKYK